jgi:hypothetical protein
MVAIINTVPVFCGSLDFPNRETPVVAPRGEGVPAIDIFELATNLKWLISH